LALQGNESTGEEIIFRWREERESQELVQIPKDFYQRAVSYISDLKSGTVGDELENSVKRLEAEMLKKVLTDFFCIRLRKLLDLVSEGRAVDRGLLAPQEIEVFELILRVIETFQEGGIKKSSKIEGSKKGKEGVLVFFKKPHPPFIATDGRIYGPFSPEDIAVLPSEDAERLIDSGVAESPG